MRNDLLGCLPTLEERLAFGLLHRTWITSASLVILVWDYFLCLDDELGHIWRRPFTFVKGLYVFARYMPLIVQSVNVYLVNGPLLASIPVTDPRPCFRWWYFLLVSLAVLLQGLDSLLMLRVYALYKKDRRIAVLFISLLACMAICQGVMAVSFVRNLSFNCTCDTINVYPPIIWLGVVIWIVQISIGMLLFSRRGLRSIGSRVVRIVNRDGVIILGLICAIFAFIIPYSTVKKNYQAHISVVVPISVISLACCRVVLNLLTININESGADPETCILTTLTVLTTTPSLDG